jgi:hypothetical protein
MKIPSVMRRGRVALVVVPLALAACSSGPGSGSNAVTGDQNSTLKSAGTKLRSQIDHYLSTVEACKAQTPSSVTCLEAADRTLGGQVHAYANGLAVGHGFSAPAADLTAARNQAQTLANDLEILGDAQPTAANYNQVLNNFNLTAALDKLDATVNTLDQVLPG